MTFILITASLLTAGCVKAAKPIKSAAKPKKQNVASAHAIAKSEERLLLKQARENLETIMKAKGATELKSALTGLALKEMAKRIASDKAANRIKVRRYDDLKLNLANYTKGIAGVSAEFTDDSYTTDLTGKQVLTKPTGAKLKLLLAMKKIEGRWLIFEIFTDEVSKKPGK